MTWKGLLLVLGASTTIGEYVIPRLLGEYQAKFPGVAIRLQVANTLGVIHMVENNQIDIGIVEGPVNNKNLITSVCWDDELVADHACWPSFGKDKKAYPG